MLGFGRRHSSIASELQLQHNIHSRVHSWQQPQAKAADFEGSEDAASQLIA